MDSYAWTIKFLDSSTDSAKAYQARLAPLISDAARAEESIDPDELEAYAVAHARRSGQENTDEMFRPEDVPAEEIQALKMFCLHCKAFTTVLAVYDSVEVWTLNRISNRPRHLAVELREQVEPSEIGGVRDFKCLQCFEYV